jgi:hypothetical protein
MPMCRAGNVIWRLSSLPPLHEQPDSAQELLPAGSARTAPGRVRRLLQPAALPRESQQSDPGRCLLRSGSNHPHTEGKHPAENYRATTPAALCNRSHNCNLDGPDPLLNLLLTYPKGSDDIELGHLERDPECLRLGVLESERRPHSFLGPLVSQIYLA